MEVPTADHLGARRVDRHLWPATALLGFFNSSGGAVFLGWGVVDCDLPAKSALTETSDSLNVAARQATLLQVLLVVVLGLIEIYRRNNLGHDGTRELAGVLQLFL